MMKKRHFMGKREAREFLEVITKQFGEVEVDKVEYAEYDDSIIFILDDEVELIKRDGGVFPYLGGSLVERLPSVTVDMGAVRFVCNGADVMAPGITDLDDFHKGEMVVIRDITHGKALAVGVSLKPSDEIKSLKKGKVISSIHYVGDNLWNGLS